MKFSEDNVAEFAGVSLFQDQNLILDEITFSIGKGEMVYLTGKTGAGKSTLLRSIYGDLHVDHGQACVVGFTLHNLKQSKLPALRRHLGIIFQDFQLFYDRNVYDNLLFVLKSTGWTDKLKIKNRISEVLIQVGLGQAGMKFPHKLSGGEQQRVVIARALLNEPKLLIADEPTGNLDPEVSRGIMEIFREINKQGTALIIATHNHFLIREYPHRILHCGNGLLKEVKAEDLANLIAVY
ncbi:MAG: ATP-binding cassette domain-containing protein [Bacteroidota bacterium]